MIHRLPSFAETLENRQYRRIGLMIGVEKESVVDEELAEGEDDMIGACIRTLADIDGDGKGLKVTHHPGTQSVPRSAYNRSGVLTPQAFSRTLRSLWLQGSRPPWPLRLLSSLRPPGERLGAYTLQF